MTALWGMMYPPRGGYGRLIVLIVGAVAFAGCTTPCGPAQARVESVIDGDTVHLEGGDSVRYLLVDTPEITSGKNECFGGEARDFNEASVLGKIVALVYPQECRDAYDRRLAFVSVDGTDVNRRLIEEGYACVLHIPPSGAERVDDFRAVEEEAKAARRGMWGQCFSTPCE